MSPALALQAAIRSRLIASSAVLALVPAGAIVGSLARPEAFPSVILGQDQEVADDITLDRRHVRVFSTLHLWDRFGGHSKVKAMAGAIREAMRGDMPALDGARCLDLRFAGSHFMTDPDGKTAHGIVEFEALVELPA